MSEHQHQHRTINRHCDVVIVGGSAAGLAAALQLGRQRRSVIVIDAGDPRNAPAAHMHGYLGREGIPPAELTAIGRAEVRSYGVEVLDGRALAVTRSDTSAAGSGTSAAGSDTSAAGSGTSAAGSGTGRFTVELTGGTTVTARRALIATGLVDELPDIDGLSQHWGRDVIHCPFCHGYEVRDRRIVAIVTHRMALHPASLYHGLSDRFTIVVHDGVPADDPELERLWEAGVTVIPQRVRRLVTGPDGRLAAVEIDDGTRIEVDAVTVGPRFRARAEIVESLGLRPVPHASGIGDVVETDATGETSVPGLYAAGNVTDPSHQVLRAAADGSLVGAVISYSLAEEDLDDLAEARSAPNEADWDHRYNGERVWSGNPNGALLAEAAGLTPGRALDVGAGEGGDAVWLAERGWKVTANDVSQRALNYVGAEAARRGLPIECLHADANALGPFEPEAFDLVTALYASIPRTPDGRGVQNLLDAVAPGGTLLVVNHDIEPVRQPIDTGQHSRAFDPDAYVPIDDFAAALGGSPDWHIEVDEHRPRPGGAASSHHVHDVVLRARRSTRP